MKKIISIVLAVLLLTSLGTAALAEGEISLNFDEMGMTIKCPAEYSQLHGMLHPEPYGQIAYGPDVFYMPIFYMAMSQEQYNELMSKDDEEITDEDIAFFQAAQGQFGMVLVSNAGMDGVMAVLGVEEMPEGMELKEIGAAEDYHYYYISETDEEFADSLEAPFADEYKKLCEDLPEVLGNSDFYTPVAPGSEMVGQTISFETTDLDGNAVSSADLFAANEVTMINYWGTWCGACVGELAELAEVHTRLQEKGCGVIGILEDGNDAEKVELAKSIMAENGTNYPNLIPSDEMSFLETVNSYPTSFFVGKDGKILSNPVSGAMVDAYEKIVDQLLAGESVSGLTMPTASANDAGAYRITVTDTDGNPVQGVAIQFCDDTSCNMGKTDADGVVSFSVPEGVVYIVHVLKVPEGYAKEAGEFHTLDVYSDLVIVLDKEA